VRTGPRKLVLLVLLAFQLVMGLQLQAAQAGMADLHRVGRAVAASSQMTGGGASGEHCPMHGGNAGGGDGAAGMDGAAESHQGAAGTHARAAHTNHGADHKNAPAGAHDCCRAGACQCSCVYTPAITDLPFLANPTPAVAVPTPANARFIPTPIDEFLRPPIA
jgi:hypothetical protein